ncbi:unnamed protein product [Sphagnum balticum]
MGIWRSTPSADRSLLVSFSSGVVDVFTMGCQRQEDSCRLSEIDIPVNIFLVEFLQNCLPQSFTFDVSVGESEEDGGKGGCVSASGDVNVLCGYGRDDGVEGLVSGRSLSPMC